MTERNSNPFVLPGLGQSQEELAGNPLLASMEMMRKAWAGMMSPGGLAQLMPMTPPMTLQDLERRIAELRTVESWLRMNLSMLSSTIQGLEVQRATIATLRSFVENVSAHAADPGAAGGLSPLEAVLGIKPSSRTGGSAPQGAPAREHDWPKGSQDRAQSRASSEEPAPPPGPDGTVEGAGAVGTDQHGAGTDNPLESAAQAMGSVAQSASEAWWSLLQQQFNQIAAATAASMPGGGGKPGGDVPTTGSPKAESSAPAAPTASKRGGPSGAAGGPAAGAAPGGTATKSRASKSSKSRKPGGKTQAGPNES
jgi:hypothetical protein